MGNQPAAGFKPPIAMQIYGQERIQGVNWWVDGVRHMISGGCMQKTGLPIDLRQKRYQRPHWGCNFVLAGAGTLVDWDGREHSLQAGDVFQRLPGLPTTLYLDTGQVWRECFVALAGATWASLRSLGIGSAAARIRPADSGAALRLFAQVLRALEGATGQDGPGILLQVQELMEFLRLQISALETRPHQAAVQAACRLLEAQLERPCEPRRVARQVQLGYETFRKAFRAEMGCSPTTYHLRRRMDHACMLLASSEASVGQIAETLGYSDAYVFSATFRRSLGRSPSAYRRRSR